MRKVVIMRMSRNCVNLALTILPLIGVASGSPYGVNAHLSRPTESIEKTADLCREAGIGCIRANVDPKNAEEVWTALSTNGIEFVGILHSHEVKRMLAKNSQLEPKALDVWSKGVRDRAVLMKGKIHNWEIWNEQNLRSFWPHANPTNYLAFLKAAYGILKDVDPRNRVVIGGFAGLPYSYLEELYTLGAKDYFDVMNFHTYPEHSIRNVSERFYDVRIERLREFLSAHGDGDKPIWVTETGAPTHQDGVGTESRYWVTNVISKALAVVHPNAAHLRVGVVSLETDSGRVDPGTVRLAKSELPEGCEVIGVTPDKVAGLLDAGGVDVLWWNMHEEYFEVGDDAVERFLKKGGTVIFGCRPEKGCFRDEYGVWSFRPETDEGAQKERRFGFSTTEFSQRNIRSNDLEASGACLKSGRYLTVANLGKSDVFTPVFEITRKTGGEKFPLVGVYAFEGGRAGSLIVSLVNRRFWRSCTEERQAVRLARIYGLLMAQGIERVFWYEFQDRGSPSGNPQDCFGIVSTDYCRKKPAYEAYVQFAKARPAGSVQAAAPWHDDSRTIYHPAWVRPDGKRAGMLWTVGTHCKRELDLGEDVVFCDYLGRPLDFPKVSGKSAVWLTDEPIYWMAKATPGVDASPDRMKSSLDVGMKHIGTLCPRSVFEIASSNWTIDGCPVDRDFVDFDKYCDYLPPLGIKKLRIMSGWAKSEKVKGKIDVSWLDHIVDWCRNHAIEVVLEFSYGNPIYKGGGGSGLALGFPDSPEGLAGWDRWVAFLSEHFRGRVREWAMWNEPNGNPKHTPEQIAAFNIRTAKILRSIIPEARIHGLSLAGSNPLLMEKCLQALGDGVKLFDTFIYHGYLPNPDMSYERVEVMKELVRKYAPHAKLRQGENGCSSEFIDRLALANIPWTEYSQAKWDMRRMLGDLGHGVESSVFGIVDINYRPPTYACEFVNRKGLLRINASNDVIRVKRAYYAVQNVVSVFDDDVRLVTDERMGSTTDRTISLYEYRAKNGAPLLAFWSRGPISYDKMSKTYSLSPEGRPRDSFETRPFVIEWQGQPFKNPVWVDLYSGRVYEFPKERQLVHACGITLFDVPVYDSPCLLTERSALEKVEERPTGVLVEGCFDPDGGHIQGICWDGENWYLSQMSKICKVSKDGIPLKDRKVVSHTGDLCYRKGLIYAAIAVYGGESAGKGMIQVFDTELNLKKEKMYPRGLDGITWLDGKLYVGQGAHLETVPCGTGGRPESRTPHLENEMLIVDPETLEVIEKKTYGHGKATKYGAQNIATDGRNLYVTFYKGEKSAPDLVVYDKEMKPVRMAEALANNGLECIDAKDGSASFVKCETERIGLDIRARIREAKINLFK